jgi:ferric-dicitrate binding protein FerR (iron transport regulator)
MKHEDDDAIAALVRLAGRRQEVDAERTARVRAAVAEEWRTTIRRRRWIRAGVAAAVAATIGGVVLLRPATTPDVRPVPIVARVQAVHGSSALTMGQSLRAGASIVVPEQTTASLDWNGATLRLDGGTRLRLDGVDAATLQGGAVYYADGGAARSITLHTRFGDVRDVGTRFEVRLRDDAMRVRVRDGIVNVRGTTARAGAELVATKASIEQHAVTTSGDEWTWIEEAAPPIVLEGQKLSDVLRQVALEKGLTLDWHGADQTLRGSVPFSTSEALDAATAAAGVRYRIEGDRLIVGGRS